MCGISAIVGAPIEHATLERMVASQHHRGPDSRGTFVSECGTAALGHNRLSIIDLSAAGTQPMTTADGRFTLVFNGEVYNYRELREELAIHYPFRSRTDSEVVLAAFAKWGPACLDRLIGMFAFAIWDQRDRELFAARDRFGVKPLHYARRGHQFFVASEIKAIHAAGLAREPDPSTWAGYLAHGTYGDGERTFWNGVLQLPAGHSLVHRDGRTTTRRWYDLVEHVGADSEERSTRQVLEEYRGLLTESIALRFRSDVAVGINLSGGVDSSALLAFVEQLHGRDANITALTFATGDDRYDELPWVRRMLSHTNYESLVCELSPSEVPSLADDVQTAQDEPFGGVPTLAYARLHEVARSNGLKVLLDGQGMDEQWAGYDYYARLLSDEPTVALQGSSAAPVRPDCLTSEFRALATKPAAPSGFGDALRNRQLRDIVSTKMPRALRFNDRASMRSSVELREPFLDHRLFELALRQPADRKIRNGTHKWLLRELLSEMLPAGIVEAPKRPLQTPQREWLREDLFEWADAKINQAVRVWGGTWLRSETVREQWQLYRAGHSDNSFYVWQWIGLALLLGH